MAKVKRNVAAKPRATATRQKTLGSTGVNGRGPQSATLRIAGALILLALVVWTYSTSFRGVFLGGDDQESIVNNSHVRTLWPPLVPLTAPANTTLAGRPVASLTFALNYAAAGQGVRESFSPNADAGSDAFYLNVWGYHAVNLLIHMLAGLALFGVVRLTLLSPALRDRFGDQSVLLAACVTAIWLVHPLQTESVTYLVQRTESLMGLFYLLTIYCVLRAAHGDFRSRFWTAAAIATCVLGLGAKEGLATVPLVATAWVWVLWPAERLRAARPLLAGLAASWIVFAWQVASAPRNASVGFHVMGWNPWLYLQTQAEVIVHYLRLAVWPHPLVLEYGWRPPDSLVDALPELFLLGVAVAATIAGVLRRRPIALAGVWFFAILAPTSSVLPIATEVAAEHRMYLPVAGVIAVIVFVLYRLLRGSGSASTAVWATAIGSAIVLPIFASATHARNRDYWSGEAIIESNLAGRPENAHVQLAYGLQLLRAKRFAESEAPLRLARDLPLPLGQSEREPRALAHFYLGSAFSAQHKLAESTLEFERALEFDDGLNEALRMLAENYLQLGRTEEAVRLFDRALTKMPDQPAMLTRAATILSTSSHPAARDGVKAVAYAERAVRLTNGRDASAIAALAVARGELGEFDRALTAINQAITLAGDQRQAGLLPEFRSCQTILSSRRPVRTSAW